MRGLTLSAPKVRMKPQRVMPRLFYFYMALWDEVGTFLMGQGVALEG